MVKLEIIGSFHKKTFEVQNNYVNLCRTAKIIQNGALKRTKIPLYK